MTTDKAYYIYGEFCIGHHDGDRAEERINKILERTNGQVVAVSPIFTCEKDGHHDLIVIVRGGHGDD